MPSSVVRMMLDFAKERGWKRVQCKNNHYKFIHDDYYGRVIASATPSDHREFENFKSHIRRAERQGKRMPHGL